MRDAAATWPTIGAAIDAGTASTKQAALAVAAAQDALAAARALAVPPTPSSGYYPPPPLPAALPVVSYDSIAGATPTNLSATLGPGGPVTQDCVIRFTPNKDYFLSDAVQGAWDPGAGYAGGGHSLYAEHVRYLWCDGAGTDPKMRARIHQPAGAFSAATVAKAPKDGSGQTNNLWAVRFGPNQVDRLVDIGAYGIEFVGHDQPTDPNTGKPVCWNGLQGYYPGAGSFLTWVKFTGFGRAASNHPPNETNVVSALGGAGWALRGVEATGFNGDGVRTGGALSANGTDAVYLENVDAHDSLVSGVTFSTGEHGKPVGSLHTVNLRVHGNANHSAGAGLDFSGVNNEGVLGPVLHENPTLDTTLDYDPAHGALHFGLQNTAGVADCVITAPAPFWNGKSPSFARGALTFQIVKDYSANGQPQTQTKMPTIFIGGRLLTPVHWQSPAMAAIDVTRQFCFVDAWI